MTDRFINATDNQGSVLPRRFKDMGDGTHAEVSYIIGSVLVTNYKTRLIRNEAGVIVAETREQGGSIDRQNWVYDGSGSFVGVDAWVPA